MYSVEYTTVVGVYDSQEEAQRVLVREIQQSYIDTAQHPTIFIKDLSTNTVITHWPKASV